MRDICVEEMFWKIYQNDFCEDVHLSTRGILGDMEEISRDDKMFLTIVERGTKKVDEHYEVALPYKMEICNYPTIRTKNAQLKKRFQKNQEFFNSYTWQIEELILKGYAKRSSNNSIKGKTCYLLPHGVKHASKPGNVRIVFDCSPNYGGTSLNKRSVFRFLWCEDSNLGGDFLSHEMCVHVFGGNSSPECCNYAPRKTAMDNEVRYGEEASQTLLHNYYVDDLLKSVKTEELAVRLIRDFKAMCQAGGFNLTKFI